VTQIQTGSRDLKKTTLSQLLNDINNISTPSNDEFLLTYNLKDKSLVKNKVFQVSKNRFSYFKPGGKFSVISQDENFVYTFDIDNQSKLKISKDKFKSYVDEGILIATNQYYDYDGYLKKKREIAESDRHKRFLQTDKWASKQFIRHSPENNFSLGESPTILEEGFDKSESHEEPQDE
jgi:hypothetical protein